MPLIVGIANPKEHGFSEEEYKLTNSLSMGIMAVAAGIGRINGSSRHSVDISVEEAHFRFSFVIKVYGKGDEAVAALLDPAFIQRMADAGWKCNVVNESPEEFLFRMKELLLERAIEEVDSSYPHYAGRMSWRDHQSRQRSIRDLVACYLDVSHSWEDHMSDFIERHESMLMKKPLWGKWLTWDDDNGQYYLAKEREEE